jgi:hypothetical protein
MDTLRAELDRACREIEAEGCCGDQLGSELVKLGVAVSLPMSGPVATLVGLNILVKQIANEFPDEWQIVKAQLTSKGTG